MRTKQANTERDIVLDILTEHEKTGVFSHVIVKRTLDRYASLPLAQRSFIKRLSEGTIERRQEMDDIIAGLLRKPDMVIKTTVRCLLRMSIYQIYYMDSVPDFAACDEAVRILRKRHMNEYTGFVNGVLRSVCRQKQARIDAAGAQTGTSAADSTGAGAAAMTGAAPGSTQAGFIPGFVRQMWAEEFGDEKTEELVQAVMKVRPVCIRFDSRTGLEEREKIISDIRTLGANVEQGRWLPECWYLSHIPSVVSLPGFLEGKWTVQDESSQMAAHAAAPEKLQGEHPLILDLCAAPGGKTMHLSCLRPDAEIIACDVSKKKTDLIRANIKRMRCANVSVREKDATVYEPDFAGRADLVICDLPCSGLGVMTRKRDIGANITQERITQLVTLQKKILQNAVRYVKPGGVLLYSTCTIDPMENEKVSAFISGRLGLAPDPLAPFLPEELPGVKGHQVQLLPSVHGTDGFFMARFRR